MKSCCEYSYCLFVKFSSLFFPTHSLFLFWTILAIFNMTPLFSKRVVNAVFIYIWTLRASYSTSEISSTITSVCTVSPSVQGVMFPFRVYGPLWRCPRTCKSSKYFKRLLNYCRFFADNCLCRVDLSLISWLSLTFSLCKGEAINFVAVTLFSV